MKSNLIQTSPSIWTCNMVSIWPDSALSIFGTGSIRDSGCSGALEHLGLLKREGFSFAVHTATWARLIQLGVGFSSLGYNHGCNSYKPNKVAANPYNHGYAHQLLSRMITILRVGWFWWRRWNPLVVRLVPGAYRVEPSRLGVGDHDHELFDERHQLLANYKPTIDTNYHKASINHGE